MQWIHDAHPGRQVRLAYCLNVHPADDLAGTRAGIEAVTLPLRDRLASGRSFGVGMYLPQHVARALAQDEAACTEFAEFLRAERLDPFTFNAFPYVGFHTDGLKADVYKPTWMERERLTFTLDVARVAARLHEVTGSGALPGHLSISTHTGMYGAWVNDEDDLKTCAQMMARAVEELLAIEAEGGPRIVLSLEAEPRANAGDSKELAAFFELARPEIARHLTFALGISELEAPGLVARHLGTCLDCCHSAVEFETPETAVQLANRGGSIGKLQFSSALALELPGENDAGRQRLLAMDEPRYLHQVTGLGARSVGGVRPRSQCADLPELAAAVEAGDEAWLDCSEWRCHFHVPVDLQSLGAGLGTTRAHADRILGELLGDPERWPTPELHVEIETYTWDVLPGSARGSGDLVDGLEREYAHVFGLMEKAGWRRV